MNIKQEDTNDVLQEIEQISNDYSSKLKKKDNIIKNEEDYDDEIINENVNFVQPKQFRYNNNFQMTTPITLPLFSSSNTTQFVTNNLYSQNYIALLENNPAVINYAQVQQNAILFNNAPLMQIQPHVHGVGGVFYMHDTSNMKNKYQNNNNINNKVYNSFPYETNKHLYNSSNNNDTQQQQQQTSKRVMNTNNKDKKNKNSNNINKKDSHQLNSSSNTPSSSNNNNTSTNTTSITNNTNNTISTTPTNTNSTLSKKIVIDDIITGKEKRTTLMLRNIPNKYTLTNLVEELNPSFWGKFDYINLPIDYDRKLNLGYAFINFVDPMHIILFYETYRLKKWTKYRSDKKMDMTYADKQGKKDINCKDDQTYFAENDKRFNFNTLQLKIEIPISHLDFFKKIYINSVCVVQQDKHPIYNDKCFIVKSFGKKI